MSIYIYIYISHLERGIYIYIYIYILYIYIRASVHLSREPVQGAGVDRAPVLRGERHEVDVVLLRSDFFVRVEGVQPWHVIIISLEPKLGKQGSRQEQSQSPCREDRHKRRYFVRMQIQSWPRIQWLSTITYAGLSSPTNAMLSLDVLNAKIYVNGGVEATKPWLEQHGALNRARYSISPLKSISSMDNAHGTNRYPAGSEVCIVCGLASSAYVMTCHDMI